MLSKNETFVKASFLFFALNLWSFRILALIDAFSFALFLFVAILFFSNAGKALFISADNDEALVCADYEVVNDWEVWACVSNEGAA